MPAKKSRKSLSQRAGPSSSRFHNGQEFVESTPKESKMRQKRVRTPKLAIAEDPEESEHQETPSESRKMSRDMGRNKPTRTRKLTSSPHADRNKTETATRQSETISSADNSSVHDQIEDCGPPLELSSLMTSERIENPMPSFLEASTSNLPTSSRKVSMAQISELISEKNLATQLEEQRFIAEGWKQQYGQLKERLESQEKYYELKLEEEHQSYAAMSREAMDRATELEERLNEEEQKNRELAEKGRTLARLLNDEQNKVLEEGTIKEQLKQEIRQKDSDLQALLQRFGELQSKRGQILKRNNQAWEGWLTWEMGKEHYAWQQIQGLEEEHDQMKEQLREERDKNIEGLEKEMEKEEKAREMEELLKKGREAFMLQLNNVKEEKDQELKAERAKDREELKKTKASLELQFKNLKEKEQEKLRNRVRSLHNNYRKMTGRMVRRDIDQRKKMQEDLDEKAKEVATIRAQFHELVKAVTRQNATAPFPIV